MERRYWSFFSTNRVHLVSIYCIHFVAIVFVDAACTTSKSIFLWINGLFWLLISSLWFAFHLHLHFILFGMFVVRGQISVYLYTSICLLGVTKKRWRWNSRLNLPFVKWQQHLKMRWSQWLTSQFNSHTEKNNPRFTQWTFYYFDNDDDTFKLQQFSLTNLPERLALLFSLLVALYNGDFITPPNHFKMRCCCSVCDNL